MPLYHLTYLLARGVGQEGRLICNRCGADLHWHSGAPNKAEMPIQLCCDECLMQCAEFLTTEEKNDELARLHKRAVELNAPVRIPQAERS